MSSAADIQKNLDGAMHEQELYADNQRIVSEQLTTLRSALNRLLEDEQHERVRAQQPIERGEQEIALNNKELEHARASFSAAEADFRKAEEKFKQKQTDLKKAEDLHARNQSTFDKNKEQALRNVEATIRKFASERSRLEREIDRREQDARSYSIKSENARRDTDILRRRLEEAHRQEMEQLRRESAHANPRATQGRHTAGDPTDAADSRHGASYSSGLRNRRAAY
jgi:chromosome segregation ATPase